MSAKGRPCQAKRRSVDSGALNGVRRRRLEQGGQRGRDGPRELPGARAHLGRAEQAECRVGEALGGLGQAVAHGILQQGDRIGQRTRLPRRRRRGRGLGVGCQIVKHHGQVDPGHAVDHRVVDLPDDRGMAVGSALEQDQLPERVAAIQHPPVHTAADLGHRAVVAGGGQHDLVDVVSDVEVRVVLPRRMRERERGEHDLLPVAGQPMQPVEEQARQLLAGDAALVEHAASDVHGLLGLLEIEEGGIDRGEATVEARLRHWMLSSDRRRIAVSSHEYSRPPPQ